MRRTRRSLRAQNPLVRRTDRIEARCFSLLVAVMVVLIPVSVWVASGMWSTQVALAEEQQADRVAVTATLDDRSETQVAGWGETAAFTTVPATWGWGDETRHADVPVRSDLSTGAEVPVWVDAQTGEYAGAPLTTSAAKFSSVLAGVALWTFSGTFASVLFGFAHWRLELRRSREWSRDIAAFLGSTSSY